MPARPFLTERSASVLQADPRLAAALMAGGASGLAHALLLPVLALEEGDWAPPDAAELGPQTAWLVVLAGWLRHESGDVFGPGDTVDPWDSGGAWRACSRVRLIVIGAAFAAAMEKVPDVAGAGATPRARAMRVGPSAEEPAEERLLALLWRLAARWGTSAGAGPTLPHELDTQALSGLLDASRTETEAALVALLARAALRRGGDGGWQLSRPAADVAGPRARHDRLRARTAEQLAHARAIVDNSRVLAAELSDVRDARRRSP
jgi:hypothetical protein